VVPSKVTAPVWFAAELKVSFDNIPHRRWLYGTYLIRGEVTVLASPGGAGKTALATGMAVEIATGTQVLGEKIWGCDLKVLFINAEDGGAEITRRVLAFCLAHAGKIAEQSPDRLYVAGADDPRVQRLSFLRATETNFSALEQEGFAVLASSLEELHPDLLILDPLVAFCSGGNMNDNAVMAQVIGRIKSLAAAFDCAVLIVHHTRKGANEGDPEAISGAAATVNLARRAIMPVPMTNEEATKFKFLPSERYRLFKLVDAKSNLAPRSADSRWYQLHSVELPNPEPPIYPHGDNVQAVERVNLSILASAPATADDQKIQRALLDLVDHGKLIDGQPFPYSPSPTGAENKRAILQDAMDAVAAATAPRQWQPDDLKAVTVRTIKAMKKEGLFVEKNMKELMPNSVRFRKGRGLIVNPERAPGAKASTDDGTAGGGATAPDGGQLVNDGASD
jgi:AAA domain